MSALYGRRAATAATITLLLWAAGTTIAYAADGPDSGGLLGPLNVQSSEGAPLNSYELDPAVPLPETVDHRAPDPSIVGVATSPGDGVMDAVRRFLASGLFALARTVTGFACWLIDWVYRFPVMEKLSSPAQKLSDAYESQIIGPLGLAGLLLAWAFVFGLVTAMRGRVARGAGEILLTLLIAGVSATAVVQPAMILGYDGPIQQTQRAALEAATLTANSGQLPKTTGPCDAIVGPAHTICLRNQPRPGTTPQPKPDRTKQCATIVGPARDTCLHGERPLNAADVSKPITRTLTDTLVVQPYMLLQYGRIIEQDSPLYTVHKNFLTPPPPPKDHSCGLLTGTARILCEAEATGDTRYLGRAYAFKELGPEGAAVAAHMQSTGWDKVLGAALVLLAGLVITLIIFTMAMVLIAAQFGCVIAAAGTVIVLTLALLPGPSRGMLWRWLGYLAGSMLTLFAISVFIPLFGVGARALLADSSTPLLERLFLLDGLAITALVMHRRIVRGTSQLGQRMANRMRYSKIGGSHTMGENAAATAAAFSSLGFNSSGAAGSPAHAALLTRQTGGVGQFAAEALTESRRALMPLAVGMRAAHSVLIGPKRPPVRPEPVGPDGLVLPSKGRMAAGGTGAVTAAPTAESERSDSDPSATETQETGRSPLIPAGSRLEASLRRTRSGRVLVRTTKAAYYSTVGLPATWTRVRRFGGQISRDLHTELGHQRDHYGRVAGRWSRDTAAAFPSRRSRERRNDAPTDRRSYPAATTEPPRTRPRRATGHELDAPAARTERPSGTPSTAGPGSAPRSWRETWRERFGGGDTNSGDGE
ncbi:hypothetical protein [Streptomyces sp. WAC01280]|uniref:hypothetical protein n=1 Tax=Streptomyces sp. WAC01280 TaxID=2487424 RepID=UPI000F76F662|nr:hypothetical protein [Streptomyces sp. WAC01280]RSS57493.1 hypothetical protein EF909_16275 [Streptomyces sp. WAC01280]